MTTIDTWHEPVPLDDASQRRWLLGQNAALPARPPRGSCSATSGAFLCVQWTGSTTYGSYWFGDIVNNKTADAYGCVLSAKTVSATGDTPRAACRPGYVDMLSEAMMMVVARSFTNWARPNRC